MNSTEMDMLRVIMEKMMKQEDLNGSPPTGEENLEPVIKRVFDNEDGLVNWIQNEQDRECAGSYLSHLKQYVIDKNGNGVRSQSEQLLPIYMRALGMSDIKERLNSQIVELHSYLKSSNHNHHSGYINWGASGIRKVGNYRSHNSGHLTFVEQLMLCASISANGYSLEPVAQSLGRAQLRPVALACDNTPDQSASRTPPESPTHVCDDRVTSNPANVWRSSPAIKECEYSPVWARHSTSFSSAPRSPAYGLFYTRDSKIPEWSTKVKTMHFQMMNRMKQIPRATLCREVVCQIPNCARSHTYLEVMQYNPLFKLLTCGKVHHYYLPNVKEDEQCPCAHVSFKIINHMVIMSKKEELCKRRHECHDGGCKKSHSIDEVCWYIPGYKTKECQYMDRCTKKSCTYYHYASGVNQDKRTGTEHIENPGKIPFVERTHQRLANAFEDLRRQGNTPA